MHEFGTVIALKESLVQVEIPRSKHCRGCHACTPLDGKDSMMLFALNDCQANIGDQVQIQIQESGELSASLLLYGVPLAVFLISLVLFTLCLPEIPALLLSFLILALSYLVIHFLSKHLNRERYMPRAICILSSSK